ncbi:hypothetical protein BJY01DRAFT_107963 [Aspergillus pseudoustus]|uniref:Indoleamine 2,3-dioxygenase n=1 Tax=Aspergillus pseudoustus TaxID=1810923 RepID=A0ABR4IUY3_9EURO
MIVIAALLGFVVLFYLGIRGRASVLLSAVASFCSSLRANTSNHGTAVSQLKQDSETHEVVDALCQLVADHGAGTWPPRASHGYSWPAALLPYHEIYLGLAPQLATEDVRAEAGAARCENFRQTVRSALQKRVNLVEVLAILSNVGEDQLKREHCNGFFACIANMRHAFRWGTIPVVKAVQEQKLIDFPIELDAPWDLLSRYYGVTSKGGNMMANYLCNFDEQGRIVYQINYTMPELIKTAEYNFTHMFVGVERMAFPIYYKMARSIILFERRDFDACRICLQDINRQFRQPLEVFYSTLVEAVISSKVWMPYVQGFAGWGAGEIKDGDYVEYDGLSGSHALFFRVVDAFLGLPPYFTDENMQRYIPKSQRRLCDVMGAHSFREQVRKFELHQLDSELDSITKQLRAFRAAHRARIQKYLRVPAPERFIMTAGKSVIESAEIPGIEDAMHYLDSILARRLKQTG